MQKTLDFLKAAGTYYLATMDGDQRCHVRSIKVIMKQSI